MEDSRRPRYLRLSSPGAEGGRQMEDSQKDGRAMLRRRTSARDAACSRGVALRASRVGGEGSGLAQAVRGVVAGKGAAGESQTCLSFPFSGVESCLSFRSGAQTRAGQPIALWERK